MASATVELMTNTAALAADLLLMSDLVRDCPDCAAERIFVPTDDGLDPGVGSYCCTTCGAAILMDLFLDNTLPTAAVA